MTTQSTISAVGFCTPTGNGNFSTLEGAIRNIADLGADAAELSLYGEELISGGRLIRHRVEQLVGITKQFDLRYTVHGQIVSNFMDREHLEYQKAVVRAMLELCMFAEGARYQEEIAAIGPKGKIECLVPGPARFWPAHLGAPPVPQLVVSPRNPKGPRALEVPVDPALLAAGDHNGSTFYQHQRFQRAIAGHQQVEVTLTDGWWAVEMGLAAQRSAATGQTLRMPAGANFVSD